MSYVKFYRTNILILLLVYLIVFQNYQDVYSEEAVKKMGNSKKQLEYAIKKYFNSNPKNYNAVIPAFNAVMKYYPDAKKHIRTAKGYMASIYRSKSIKNYDKALMIYKELINQYPKKDPYLKQIFKGMAHCLLGNLGTEENYMEFLKLRKTLPEVDTRIFSIEYAVMCMGKFIQSKENDELLNRSKMIMMKLITDDRKLTLEEFMIVRHLLGLVTLCEIYKKEKKAIMSESFSSNYKKDKIELLLNSVTLSSGFPPPPEYNFRMFLLKSGKDNHAVFNYLNQTQVHVFSVISHIINEDINKKTLTEKGGLALDFLMRWNYVKGLPLLKKLLNKINGKNDKKKVRDIINHLER